MFKHLVKIIPGRYTKLFLSLIIREQIIQFFKDKMWSLEKCSAIGNLTK